MKWQIDDHGRLVITVTRKEQRSLKSTQGRNLSFDSDTFMHELLEPMATNGFIWLPEGCTDDLTSAPMLGILGDQMAGPDDPQDAIGMGLVHVGCWDHHQMYQPVLKRWAFMDYQISSPQRELAETGECVWEGGEYWETQEDAKRAVAEAVACE